MVLKSILRIVEDPKPKSRFETWCWHPSSLHFSCVQLFVKPWTAASQASLSILPIYPSLPPPGACSNSCPSSRWCHPTILSSVIPFSRLQSFLSSGCFSMSQVFASSDQSIGVSASASVFPMNIQDWFSLRWTGWISLQSKGLSRVSNITVQSISSSVLSFLYGPSLTHIHDYWENHRFDYRDICWQSDVCIFLIQFLGLS